MTIESRLPTDKRLKVFISSKMIELRDVRDIITAALDEKGVDAWIYEAAGARPEDVIATSLQGVEDADIYVGLFGKQYGEVTVQEYRHARILNKPSFVYIRDKDIQREEQLDSFLRAKVYDLQRGVTYAYFDSAVKLGKQAANDIMTWLVRQHREMTAEIQQARVSQDEIARLRAKVDRLQDASRERLPQGTGKFHSPDNSLLNFCSSPFRVEAQCQPQRGGTDRHEIHETAGY